MAYTQARFDVSAAPLATRTESAWADYLRSSKARRLSLEAHEALFFEGDPAERVFEVAEGSAMLYKLLPDGRRQVVEVLGPGDMFGFDVVGVYDCTAESLTPCIVHAIERRDIETAPALQEHLTRCVLAKLHAMHDHAVLLGRKSAFERVASFLIRFVPQRGVLGCVGPTAGEEDTRTVELPMTRQEIADYLGLTIETVSRVFSDMRRRGLISLEKHDRVMIRDVCSLCRCSGTH
ncbi:MAG: helix-turn-helix domain-containing protein [Hyphomicrobiaceae bacterium]|nr:helix-turn-helix domain-containing protein [Hyphomicrobiaceae bacterium]